MSLTMKWAIWQKCIFKWKIEHEIVSTLIVRSISKVSSRCNFRFLMFSATSSMQNKLHMLLVITVLSWFLPKKKKITLTNILQNHTVLNINYTLDGPYLSHFLIYMVKSLQWEWESEVQTWIFIQSLVFFYFNNKISCIQQGPADVDAMSWTNESHVYISYKH